MKKSRILVALLATFAPAAFAGLPTGLSGAWYNPAQSGHGIHLEMVSTERAIGAWNVFDTAGNPMHLYLDGVVQDDVLVLQAYAPRGMKFGSFDRANYSAPRWGTVTLDFADCDHAQLTYAGDGVAGAGFGQGTMPLQRLTRIGGTTCSFDDELVAAPAGVYDDAAGWPNGAWTGDEFRLHAAVDAGGRLWMTSAWTPGPTYLSGVGYSPVLIASPPVATSGELHAAAVVRYNSALTRGRTDVPGGPAPTALAFASDPAGNVSVAMYPGVAALASFSAVRPAGPSVIDDLDFDTAALDGRRFTFTHREQFFDMQRTIEFGGSLPGAGPDHICIPHNSSNVIACEFEGRITDTDEGLAMFDFVLNHSYDPGRQYRGKGWLRSDTGELVMVAEGGERGFGLVADPKN